MGNRNPNEDRHLYNFVKAYKNAKPGRRETEEIMSGDVLIIKNAEKEGPGILLEFLRKRSIRFTQMDGCDEDLTERIVDPYDYLVVLGGSMAVYEMETCPGLKRVFSAMQAALEKEKKILGICLGAQLLAHLLGGRVYYSGEEEIGWCDIELTDEGLSDKCFSAFASRKKRVEVFQWHSDTFDLPQCAKRLAFSDRFANQAFSYNGSYGLQFHPEITQSMIFDWFEGRQNIKYVLEKTATIYPSYEKAAERFFECFFFSHEERR